MQTSQHGSRMNKPRIFLGSSGKQASADVYAVMRAHLR
jgi:hypothetical protein